MLEFNVKVVFDKNAKQLLVICDKEVVYNRYTPDGGRMDDGLIREAMEALGDYLVDSPDTL